MRRVRVKISGHVQGVFYRAACAELAERLGLAGSIRNAPGGAVEAVFEGDDGRVDDMLAWCREGPPLARVVHVDMVDEAPAGQVGFRVTH